MDMGKKILCFVLFALFTAMQCKLKGQDTKNLQHQFNVDAGGLTNCFFGNTYIENDTNNVNSDLYFKHIGYRKCPSTSFNIGTFYELNLKNKYKFNFGLSFSNRRKIFKCDSFNLVVNKKWLFPNIDIYKYVENIYNLELNLSSEYSYKWFSCCIGTRIPLINYQRENQYHLNDGKSIESQSFKFCFSKLFNEQLSYIFVMFKYTFINYRIKPSFYIGIDDFINPFNQYHLNISYGMQFCIFNVNNK